MKRPLWLSVCGILFLLLALGISWADEPVFSSLKIGREAPWFSLPSSEGRLVDYAKDYLGKHHLVMTFFPAAFTPV
ncbi:MAG: hypothetical protein ACUVWO_13760 [Thermodesulfobacteriota bacterium]